MYFDFTIIYIVNFVWKRKSNIFYRYIFRSLNKTTSPPIKKTSECSSRPSNAYPLKHHLQINLQPQQYYHLLITGESETKHLYYYRMNLLIYSFCSYWVIICVVSLNPSSNTTLKVCTTFDKNNSYFSYHLY